MTEPNLDNLEVPTAETVTVLGDTPAPETESPVVFDERQQALFDKKLRVSRTYCEGPAF